MAINFPTSLDNFTNPVSGNTLDSPSHSLQHSDINDAVEALERKIGVGTAVAGSASAGQVLTISAAGTSTWSTPNTGLVLLNTTSFSASSSLSLSANLFTSTYENYKLIFTFTALSATQQTITFKLRASGTDTTGLDYYFERIRNENGALTATRFAGNDTFFAGSYNTTGAPRNYKEVNLYSPQIAVQTSYNATSNYVDNAGSLKTETMGGYHALSVSYDSISIIPSSGTMTGTVRVYGYTN